MAKDNSDKYSKENYNLLNGMKRYLRIEHKDDDKDLLSVNIGRHYREST